MNVMSSAILTSITSICKGGVNNKLGQNKTELK